MNNQDEINRLNKERDEVLKRIEENKRLMEFIQNKNIKGGLNDLELYKKKKEIHILNEPRYIIKSSNSKEFLFEKSLSDIQIAINEYDN